MKKTLIGTLVGGLILFFWQFLSWSLLNVHGAETAYTPNQEKIMAFLSENIEEGSYMLPTVPPGASEAEFNQLNESSMGKPWAQISYHNSRDMNMGMNLLRGLVIDFLAIFLLCWILLKMARLDFSTALLSSLAVGAIAYLTIPYLNQIWFEGNTTGYIIDLFAQWGLVGVWLGWWLPR